MTNDEMVEGFLATADTEVQKAVKREIETLRTAVWGAYATVGEYVQRVRIMEEAVRVTAEESLNVREENRQLRLQLALRGLAPAVTQ